MTCIMISTIIQNMDPVKNKTSEVGIRLNQLITVEGLVVPHENPNVVMLNELMAKRLVGSQVKSHGEKMYKEAGDNLEYLATTCGLNIAVAPGNSIIVHDNGTLKLEKSVRAPFQKVNTDHLLDFLRQAGIQEELLQQAKTAATSYSKPAVYLTVKSSLK